MSAHSPQEDLGARQRSARMVRRVVALGAAVMVLIGLLLLYLLTQATNNQQLYERNYASLFTINVAVAGLLLAAVVWVAYQLVVRLRKKKFGSKLLLKLAIIFSLVGFAPGLLIYVVSYQFVSRSIETWFDVKVEGALDAGLNLGRVSLEALSSDLIGKSRVAANQISETPDSMQGVVLERMLEQLGASDVVLWESNGQVVASAGLSGLRLSPDKPSAAYFRTARNERGFAWIVGLDEASAEAVGSGQIKVLVPLASASLGLVAEQKYLQVTKEIPSSLVANAMAVEGAYREYQERALSREGLKRMYIGTLTLSLFLAVFGAVLLAVVLGNQIVRPLLLLAEGVNQVASGDFTPKLAMQGRDELGGLTRAFASMTEQLADARKTVQHSLERVSAAREHLQTILDNLTAGVIVLGEQGQVQSSNPGAARILKVAIDQHMGARLEDLPGLQVFGRAVQSQFAEFMLQRGENAADHWQHSFQLGAQDASGTPSPFEQTVTLVARGAQLPDNAWLLVFDDISEIISAQRSQAWGEVARRLAHEIKNPLTPIQLSAERLEMKLTGKVAAPEQIVLTKSVKTIVDQVDAMKRLVNEFRDYARLPAAQLHALDLNALIVDVLHLYETGSQRMPIRTELDSACPLVLGDAQQLRQVIHNLLQNAQDAIEALDASVVRERAIVLRTQWKSGSTRVRFSVLDSGVGLPDAILQRAMEPYVTTKVRGTGLGLAVVKKIADEHGARLEIVNRIEDERVVGAQVSLSLAVDNSAQG